jgi:hypothetical protein
VPEELTQFDDRMAELQWANGRWQLWAGGELLKDFGRREADARQALQLVRELQLTQHGIVGSPRPMMEYWLSDGQAPHGLFPGLRTTPIDQRTLRVQDIQGYWCVRDGARVLFNFGPHQDQAEQALAVIHKYAFTKLGMIGQAPPSMLVFLGEPLGLPRMSLHDSPPLAGRVVTSRQMISTGLPAAGMVASEMPQSSAQQTTPLPPGVPPTTSLPPGAAQAPAVSHLPGGNGSTGNAVSPALLSSARQLAPPTTPAASELEALAERVPLDYHQVRLQHDRLGWRLMCANYLVADFGSDENAARRAELAFQAYRFTEQCLVGRPKPVLSYFLVNGRPPNGIPLGAQGVSFRPEELAVRQVDGGWAICTSTGVLLPFGDKAEEARQALRVMQKQGFDTFCHLGPWDRGMTILARVR